MARPRLVCVLALMLPLPVATGCYNPRYPSDSNQGSGSSSGALATSDAATTAASPTTSEATSSPDPSSTGDSSSNGGGVEPTGTGTSNATEAASSSESGRTSEQGSDSSTGPTPIDDDGPYGNCSVVGNCPDVGPLGCLQTRTHSVCAPGCVETSDCPAVEGATSLACFAHWEACLLFCEGDEDCPAGLECAFPFGDAMLCAWQD